MSSETKAKQSPSDPLLGSPSSKKKSPAPGYHSIAPVDYYYVDEYDDLDEDGLSSSKHFAKHKYTYWIAIFLISIPLVYAYFQITLGIEPNFIRVPDLVRVESLNAHHAPSQKQGKRVILIGDIHGKIKSFKRLLEEVEFNSTKDHLVLLGDIISKGPNSVAVLDYAMSVNASCVRGNHEDYILKQYANLHKLPVPKINPPEDTETAITLDNTVKSDFFVSGNDKTVARKLKPEHIKYLGTCPAIMDLGKVGFHGTSAVAVHAGLQWNIENLQDQDPEVVFSIRSLLPPRHLTPSEEMDGIHWSKIWNAKQKLKPKNSQRMSVIYGHDARNGLNLQKYTAGLDTGCVNGGELTALVISEDVKGNILHDITSVPC